MISKPPPNHARRRNRLRLGAVAVAFALGAAACGNDDDPSVAQSGLSGAEGEDVAATDEADPTDEVDFASSSGIDGEDPEFNLSALV